MRGAAWQRMAKRVRTWALPAMVGSLLAFGVGFAGTWLLTQGAGNLAGAVAWLSGLVLFAGALESERRRTASLLALLAGAVMILAALGRIVGGEFYLPTVWALAAAAGSTVFGLFRPASR
jgi:hypothetical protein